MDYYASSREAQGEVQVAAILGQEHHLHGDKWSDFQHQANRGGWRIQGAQGLAGVSGHGSVGVCIAARNFVQLARAADMPLDISPRAAAGRLASAEVDGVLRGGMLVLSVYLWHAEGLAERNVGSLNAAGGALPNLQVHA